MSHQWQWQFWHTIKYVAARIICLCGWATRIIPLRTVHEQSRTATLHLMDELEMLAHAHTPHRGWDLWEAA